MLTYLKPCHTVGLRLLAVALPMALAVPDARQCQSDCTQGKLGGFCYGLVWYRMLDLAYALA